ncbi:MrcB family domain-containing protein [Natrononativus amylolyticus]|uniref:MrcB family domain-containing protein n=1 Tax=Natrononativus amylolyticus TaxID=2963434 RepID=UPI0020CF0EA8|nr:DUF3578 domain-containing protein [Natrononativus amylolyticus]
MSTTSELSNVLYEILEEYPSPSKIGRGREYENTDADEELRDLVKQTSKDVVSDAIGDEADDYNIRPTIGSGGMADIPYIPIERRDETQTTKKGIYVVYLFDAATSTVYLTLNQGATEAQRASGRFGSSPPNRLEILRRHAEDYRQYVDWPPHFTGAECELTESINAPGEDDVEEVKRADSYNAGCILYRAYGLDDLRDTQIDVVSDLKDLLTIYETLLDRLYSIPDIDIGDRSVWELSPAGGSLWTEWRDAGIASIGHSDTSGFDVDDDVDEAEFVHNSPEGQLLRFQHQLSEGDLIVAGAPHEKIDVAFGMGHVTKTHYETMEEIDDPSKVGSGECAETGHKRFVRVEWSEFAPEGVAVNCLKDGKKIFHNWTIGPFKAEVDHFLGAVARRMVVLELIDDSDAFISDIVNQFGYRRLDDGRPAGDPPIKFNGNGPEPDDTTETYAEWWQSHEDLVLGAPPLESPSNLVFPDDLEETLINRIETTISNGKHLILTGPPGTGKTKLARHVADHYAGTENHELVTATSDWSTFDTIGGYRPQQDSQLKFHPGLFLNRFQTEDSAEPSSEWLIIDELNRADIDKAFGSLLSALTGETVQLPFEGQESQITLVGGPTRDSDRPIHEDVYFIPDDWRLIGTMNTYDKTSLYQLSYAFMRRFAFIPVPIPEEITPSLIQDYTEGWFDERINDETATRIAALWETINSVRPIGPAILRDILADYQRSTIATLTDPIIMHVMPQLEGLPKGEQREFVAKLREYNSDHDAQIDIEEITRFVEEYFGVDVDGV